MRRDLGPANRSSRVARILWAWARLMKGSPLRSDPTDDERLSSGRADRLDRLHGPVRDRDDAAAAARPRELRTVARLPGGLDESVEHRMTYAKQSEQRVVPVHQSTGRREVVPSQRLHAVERDPPNLPNGISGLSVVLDPLLHVRDQRPARRAYPRVPDHEVQGRQVGAVQTPATRVPFNRP